MRSSFMRKGFAILVVSVLLLMLMTSNVFAATTYIVKDGAFQNAGFINAGETVEGTIQGPGNWTQLNLGDAAVDVAYLHIIMKAEGGDTTAAQIGVSDLYTFNLSELGITLTEEYQDVVLPVLDQGITLLTWLNCMGLDGGTVTYTVKDVFLSEDAASTLAVEVAKETVPVEEVTAEPSEVAAEADVPKTGEVMTTSVIALLCMAGTATLYLASKKKVR